jgi:predicted nucleic acid-binding protein
LKRFFDSSVLVPVFYADHPQHASSTKLFLEAGKEDFCALRTLGEVYATLTGLPLRPRITGPEGIRIIEQIRERLTLIALGEQEYVSALKQASSEAIVGAAAYDALIAHCALKAGADVLLTWNVRDFTRFGSAVAQIVKTPLDLQSSP